MVLYVMSWKEVKDILAIKIILSIWIKPYITSNNENIYLFLYSFQCISLYQMHCQYLYNAFASIYDLVSQDET